MTEENPLLRAIREAEEQLAMLRRQTRDALYTTPVPTEVVIQPKPMKCDHCRHNPAQVVKRTENGQTSFYYVRSLRSSKPLCENCEHKLTDSFYEGFGC